MKGLLHYGTAKVVPNGTRCVPFHAFDESNAGILPTSFFCSVEVPKNAGKMPAPPKFSVNLFWKTSKRHVERRYSQIKRLGYTETEESGPRCAMRDSKSVEFMGFRSSYIPAGS